MKYRSKPGWFGTQRSQKPRAPVTHLRAQTRYYANMSENPWLWLVFTQRDGSSRLWTSLMLTDGPGKQSECWSVTERWLLTVTAAPRGVFMRHFTRVRRTLTSSCLTNDTHVHWSVCAHALLSATDGDGDSRSDRRQMLVLIFEFSAPSRRAAAEENA